VNNVGRAKNNVQAQTDKEGSCANLEARLADSVDDAFAPCFDEAVKREISREKKRNKPHSPRACPLRFGSKGVIPRVRSQ
jgi:hypothetical protein